MRSPTAALAALLLLLLACAAGAHAAGRKLQQGPLPVGTEGNPRTYKLNVTVGTRSPDCYTRKVLLVNGEFQPTLTFTQGEWVQVNIINNIPDDWPSVTKGISIHMHGFSFLSRPWLDGTRNTAQCPIARGSSFALKFKVTEMPGTYFWHDHASLNRADGLQGPLIVRPPPRAPGLYPTPGRSTTLFLSDWWHQTGNALAMRLNRPFSPAQATNASGSWCWVGLPKSLLINGVGNYYDCEDVYTRQVNGTLPNGKPVTPADVMAPNACVAGQLGPAAAYSTCSPRSAPLNATCTRPRLQFDVGANETMLLRIINAGTLVYMTVCVEKHSLTVVALDAAPVEPKAFYECVDVNTGQRADVLIKADQPRGSYWITAGSQYRKGAPNAFATIKYIYALNTTPSAEGFLQPAQIETRRWNTSVIMSFAPPAALLSPDAPENRNKSAPFLAPATAVASFKLPAKQPDVRLVVQSTQPIIEVNGILRWAFDNVADTTAPPCKPVLDLVYDDPTWAEKNALPLNSSGLDPSLYFTPTGGDYASWQGKGEKVEVVDANGPNRDVVLKLGKPGAGTHVLSLPAGQLIEIVVQNNRAGLFGGEYNTSSGLTSNRNGREQHSFHQHGHHVWMVGMGMGEWTPDKVSEYSTANPILRDTVTVLFNGTTEAKAAWVAFRFVANNPGAWPMHCHIAWHERMGQSLTIIEDAPGIAKLEQPKNMPACPERCIYSFAQTNPTSAAERYGSSGLLAPDSSQLP